MFVNEREGEKLCKANGYRWASLRLGKELNFYRIVKKSVAIKTTPFYFFRIKQEVVIIEKVKLFFRFRKILIKKSLGDQA